MRWLPVIGLIVCILQGCGAVSRDGAEDGRGRKYFVSPEQAVEVVTQLLQAEDYGTLADYYDLSGSNVDRSDLEGGEYFAGKQKPEVAHPGGFWQYEHPFAPGFKLDSVLPTDRTGVFRVIMTITIEQGADSPSQEGVSHFYMIKSPQGWQVLPRVAFPN